MTSVTLGTAGIPPSPAGSDAPAKIPPPQRSYLAYLDGIRGFAALWVLIAHCMIWGGWYWQRFPNAKIAVDLFMSLSASSVREIPRRFACQPLYSSQANSRTVGTVPCLVSMVNDNRTPGCELLRASEPGQPLRRIPRGGISASMRTL